MGTPLLAGHRQGERNPKADDRDEVNPVPALPQIRHIPLGPIVQVSNAKPKWKLKFVLGCVIRTQHARKERWCVGIANGMVERDRGVLDTVCEAGMVVVSTVACR
jgi:hypothetical protein